MSLKELTAEKHRAAENTKFMKAVFERRMTKDVWADWTKQKYLIYREIESRCQENGYLKDLSGIERAERLMDDYSKMIKDTEGFAFRDTTFEYQNYIRNLDAPLLLAHLYTWHLGDMFGGQMIRNIIDAPHSSLDFDNAPVLIANLRAKLSDDLGPEANCAFDWAIKMMDRYDI
jgi:heme oxygenase